jgi:hypothetical protein
VGRALFVVLTGGKMARQMAESPIVFHVRPDVDQVFRELVASEQNTVSAVARRVFTAGLVSLGALDDRTHEASDSTVLHGSKADK